MPDETRVFDVSKPSKVSPSATSRPVIVGHHPMSDPMVKTDNQDNAATKIPITVASQPAIQPETEHSEPDPEPDKLPDEPEQGSPAIFSQPDDHQPAPAESVGEGPFTDAHGQPEELPEPVLPDEPLIPDPPSDPDGNVPPNDFHESNPAHSSPHIEGLHFSQPPRRGGKLKFALLGILILLIAAYLAIDSGLINAGFKLPFHVFKQKTPAVSTTTATPKTTTPAAPALPAGFKQYNLTGTDITFAAPAVWGAPASAPDPGFSQRGAGKQSDGTYAYVVSFDGNKDIQIAVTSDKYLPTVRKTLYYDYLQWCMGTADNKIYESVLNFSTTNKVDTPTTVTCDQGPVPATKLDSSTIVQTKATDPAGAVIGDIYVKNIDDPTWVVFRVKDAAMTSSNDIEQLLKTVKASAAQTNSTGNSTGSQQ
jgi:hypothetical protein